MKQRYLALLVLFPIQQYFTMMAQGFRLLRPSILKTSARRLSSTCLRRSSAFSYSQRRAASVAALVAATSVTALAASQDNSNRKDHWQLHRSPSKTQCETQSTVETFPEVLLKYDHYNGVIVHLDWILSRPDVDDKLFNRPKDDEDVDVMNPERQQQLNQLYQDWINNPKKFEDILQRSLKKFKEDGRKGIWIHVPRAMAGVVPVR